MFSKQKKGKLIYGIIGMGRFGLALAQELHDSGCELMIVDRNEEKVALAREITENAYIVKNLDKKTLLETGIHNCDVVIVGIGEEIDTSILVTLNLVSMNIPTVISKATTVEHGEILKKLGAEVVYPERDMAIRLAHRLQTSQTLDFIQLSEKIDISKLLIPQKAIGKTVMEIDLRKRFGVNIIAIESKGKVMESVSPEYVFCDKDILYLSGSKDGFVQLAEWTNK